MPEIEKVSLRKPQILILSVLSKSRGPMTRKKVSEKTGVAENMLCPMLGSIDPKMREKAEARVNCVSLISLGYAEVKEYDIDGLIELGYKITPTGVKALEAISSDRLLAAQA